MKTALPFYETCVKRCTEMLTKSFFLRLVHAAYRCRDSAQHEKIMSKARQSYGIEPVAACRRLWSRWFIDFIVQAQHDIFASTTLQPFALGPGRIGVGDLKICCSTGDVNSSGVYLMGFSDNLTFFRLYSMFAPPDSVAVDVGANLGMHTLVLADCVSRGVVFSFEPRRSVYGKLIGNVSENGITNVIVSDKALGDSVGVSLLHVDENDFNIGKARLGERGNQAVEVTTLDDVLKDSASTVSLVKIDTEGYELQVIRGATRVLAEHRPVVISEFSPSTYSFRDLKHLIPYRACYFRIPQTYYEKLEPMHDDPAHPCDLLIVPEDKLTREVQDKLDTL